MLNQTHHQSTRTHGSAWSKFWAFYWIVPSVIVDKLDYLICNGADNCGLITTSHDYVLHVYYMWRCGQMCNVFVMFNKVAHVSCKQLYVYFVEVPSIDSENKGFVIVLKYKKGWILIISTKVLVATAYSLINMYHLRISTCVVTFLRREQLSCVKDICLVMSSSYHPPLLVAIGTTVPPGPGLCQECTRRISYPQCWCDVEMWCHCGWPHWYCGREQVQLYLCYLPF